MAIEDCLSFLPALPFAGASNHAAGGGRAAPGPMVLALAVQRCMTMPPTPPPAFPDGKITYRLLSLTADRLDPDADRAAGQTTPSRVFAALASEEAKNWGATGDLEPAEEQQAGPTEFGGRERFGHKMHDTTYRYDATYYDIVPDQRLVYTHEMYADDVRISVSLTTIEFVKCGNGTALTWTEQGVYLDGFDGTEAAALRKGGTAQHLDLLTGYLERRAAADGPA